MSPELLGVPVAVWALVISVLSLTTAAVALGWQVTKHFLDGGRVKVYLRVAVWEPELAVWTTPDGRHVADPRSAHSITRGQAIELAQLVIENPGRSAVTIHTPALHIGGMEQENYSLTPRAFNVPAAFGAEVTSSEPVVRLEPYGRTTFLLDIWRVMPGLIEKSVQGRVRVRGQVRVAGRPKPFKSAAKLAWEIERGDYTALAGPPDFTPYAVLWGELFRQTPSMDEEEAEGPQHPNAPRRITQGMVGFVLESAMARFDARPPVEDLKAAIEEEAEALGDRYPMLGFALYEGYEALDRMEGHLTDWTEGISPRKRRRAKERAIAAPAAPEPIESHVVGRSGGRPMGWAQALRRRWRRPQADQ